MNQEPIRVKFSLKAKILASVVLLLVIVITFLNLSTIVLLQEDKRAYIYQAQSTEAVLAGREFINTVSNSIDTIKLSLASVDPSKAFTMPQKAALQSVLNNQSELLGVTLAFKNSTRGEDIAYGTASNPVLLKQRGLADSDLIQPTAGDSEFNQALTAEGYAFFNPSRVGQPPLLGIAVADLKLKDSAQGLPVAYGFVSLDDFLKDVPGANFFIADRLGQTLFSTNAEELFSRKRHSDHPLFQRAQSTQLATGATEFEIEGENHLGSYFKPGLGVTVVSQITLKKAMRSAEVLTIKFIVLAGMSIGAAMIFALIFARRLTGPLKKLFDATKEVAKGHFELELDIKSKDEIGALSESFSAMSKRIRELIVESMEKVRLEGEIKVANAVQQSLIPASRFVSPQIRIHSHYESASECGGDWWGFFSVGNKLCINIADATGHGVPSALITAAARSSFSILHKIASENPNFPLTPGEMLRFANRSIFDTSGGRIMMTFFSAVIDFDAMTLTYASAGHNPPWYFKKTGNTFTMKSLTAKGTRLGEKPDVPTYSEKKISIYPGDMLFMYTDGIIEGTSPQGDQYGKKQVIHIVEKNLVGGPELVVQNLIKDFKRHNTGKPLDDDITLAAVTFLPPATVAT